MMQKMKLIYNRFMIRFVIVIVLLATTVGSTHPLNSQEAVASFRFSKDEISKFHIKGTVDWEQAGPTQPEYPSFPKSNRAIFLDGRSFLEVKESGQNPRFSFANGDTLSMEAWVRVDRFVDSNPMYVIGKGRTGNKNFKAENQNWSLRIVGEKQIGKLSFLFATHGANGKPNWHRWTSRLGFVQKTGWHHIALTYRFGKPDSIRGWIDGVPTKGVWDIQGKTSSQPVRDRDQVWIGSALGGNPGNCFKGWIDEIKIFRHPIHDTYVSQQFRRRTGPQVFRPQSAKMPSFKVNKGKVLFAVSEGLTARDRWQHSMDPPPKLISRWEGDSFLLPRIPNRFDGWGIRDDWKVPILIQIGGEVHFDKGQHRLLVRARSLSRLWLDGKVVATTKAITHQPPNGEEPVTPVAIPPIQGMRPKSYHQQETVLDIEIKQAGSHRVLLEMIVGGKNYRAESGEVCVASKSSNDEIFNVLLPQNGSIQQLPLKDPLVAEELERQTRQIEKLDGLESKSKMRSNDTYWNWRHRFANTWVTKNQINVPPGDGHPVDRFLEAKWKPALEKTARTVVIDDESFVRRVYLDATGLPPSVEQVQDFLNDDRKTKRARLVNHLLTGFQMADNLMGEWQDILAENPTLLNASLNSTGPFRWYLYDSFRHGKPFDRMVTELIMMRGGTFTGGSSGFGLAAENDSPFAAKAHILASAFLGIEMQCARCHDSPFHSTTQEDLYSMAAMLARKPLKVARTSSVPPGFFEEKNREPLIEVSLKPGVSVSAVWPFAKETGVKDDDSLNHLLVNPKDSRERLAGLITSPANDRFAKVIVNRLWKRLMGAGMVEPVHDWETSQPSHPELLSWLANELKANRFDIQYIMRLIMTSQAYQREAVGNNLNESFDKRLFKNPDRRRLSAEQVVDSLFFVTGNPMDVEELTFVHDGRRSMASRLTLGKPTRAWMLASLNNERDRPSLSLPRARAVVDVLKAFGWNGSRQKPIQERNLQPNLLQPGILANGNLAKNLNRVSIGSRLARQAIEAKGPEQLVKRMFLQVLSRHPNKTELAEFSSVLQQGFDQRVLRAKLTKSDLETWRKYQQPLPLVTWFNHQRPKATEIQLKKEERVRQGPLVDPRLESTWREAYEDVVWSLINHREFVWIP